MSYHRTSPGRAARAVRRVGASLIVAAAVQAVGPVHRALGVTRNWTGGVGGAGISWSVAGNWSPSGGPTSGDGLLIPRVNDSDPLVVYDYTGPAVTLSSLTLSCTPFGGTPGTSYLSIGGNSLSANTEILGDSGGTNIGRGEIDQ